MKVDTNFISEALRRILIDMPLFTIANMTTTMAIFENSVSTTASAISSSYAFLIFIIIKPIKTTITTNTMKAF
jgi:hypothetical protein